MGARRRLGFGATAGLAMLLAAGVFAQEAPTRALVAVPFNQTGAVALSVGADRSELKIGETVEICFQASRPGHVSLWNVSTAGAVTRIFPNALQQAGSGLVEGGRRQCAGAAGDAFRFQVEGPPGLEDLYLLWTTAAEIQPASGTYKDATLFAAELERLRGLVGDQWGTAKTSYDIVPREGAKPPALPRPTAQGGLAPPRPSPPAVAAVPAAPKPPPPAAAQAPVVAPAAEPGRVLILAMGSNVKPLTKTNQDAALFTDMVARLFGVRPDDQRVLANATKADFAAGMAWLRERARPADLVIIFYSGHGMQVRDPTGTSSDGLDEAFVPYDFETLPKPSGRNLVWSQEFARWVNALPTDTVITVVDACHSAGLYRSVDSTELGAKAKVYVPPADLDLAPPAELAVPATRALGGSGREIAKGVLLAAASRRQSALEVSDGGLFTVALLRDLAGARGGSLREAFERAAATVDRRTGGRQSPQAIGDLAPTARLALHP